MLKKIFGTAAQRVVTPLGAAVGRAGITPNMITVAGFLITVMTAVLIGRGRLLLGGVVLIAGSLLDMLDGAVARATGSGSKAGAFLDSTLDRFSDAAIFVGLIWFYASAQPAAAGAQGGLQDFEQNLSFGAGLALVNLVLSLMVSYVRARAEGLGFTCNVGIAERPERIALVCAGLILDLMIPALLVLAVASAFTVAQRFVHVWRQAKAA